MILVVPFKTRKYIHRLKAYNKIMQNLPKHKLRVNLQILDNEARAEYKQVIKEK